ncbi:MAG: PQQ-binding-like beta-propeller repeat protein [Bauldia sp.]|nr:PQQ-binding-like beta-propeller repeat protein [Bauldia sp.]
MKHKHKLWKYGAVALLLSSVAQPALAEDTVTFDRLANPEAENWLHVFGNYEGWRYSALDEINRDTVAGLRFAFAVPLSMQGGLGGNLQSAPLADDGFIYTVDMTNAVVKIDAGSGTSGTQLWRVETTPPEQQGRLQGPALWGDNVYSVTRFGTVLGIARDSGEVLWEQSYVEPGEFFDASPVALDDSLIIGQAIGDAGTRGYVIAVDPVEGAEQWRTYMVPGPGEPGHETWPQDNDSWMTGGGGVWISPTYDPDTNLIFVGTGNPSPAWDAEFRPGDNLYTASTVVLNGDTGEIVWYFQYTPNDAHEHDEVSPHLLFDVPVNGEMRSALGHLSRTGYYYTFDRNTGEFLGAVPHQTNIDWTAGIDPKTGKPVEYDPDAPLQRYALNPERSETPVSMCGGGFITGTWPPAYDPERQRVFNTSPDTSCLTTLVDWDFNQSVEQRFGAQGLGGPILGAEAGGWRLAAIDATTGEIAASADLPDDIESRSGTLTTAGGLVFLGNSVGALMAYDADTLDLLWSTNVGAQMLSPPFSYAVNGKQYIAIQTGGAPNPFGFFGAPVGPNSSGLIVFTL